MYLNICTQRNGVWSVGMNIILIITTHCTCVEIPHCMCAGYVHVSASAEETRGVESFVARITGCWYLPDMGARNPIWVLCKSGTYFKPLSHLSSPQADNLNLIPGNHMAGENQLPQAILLHSYRYTVCLPLLLYVIKNIKQHKNIRSGIYTHFKIHHYPKNKIQ